MKKLRSLALALCTTALVGLAPSAHAVWSHSFTDMGVNYTLSFLGQTGDVGSFELTVDTTGYDQQPSGFLDSVSIKAWEGTDISFTYTAPAGSAWGPTEGPISSGPVSNAGCGGSDAGFTCLEAVDKGVFDVASGPYSFTFDVTAASFNSTGIGAHVGAGYADMFGNGSSYGITSVSVIPEPEIYAMMLAGLALMFFVARRRSSEMEPQFAAA
jgi:hypothetical protein